MDIIVTHFRLDVADFDSDRNEVPDSCRTIGITKIIVPAIQSRTWPKVLELYRNETGLYPALGFVMLLMAACNRKTLSCIRV